MRSALSPRVCVTRINHRRSGWCDGEPNTPLRLAAVFAFSNCGMLWQDQTRSKPGPGGKGKNMKSNRNVSRREFLGTAAATAAVSYFGHPSMAFSKASASSGVDSNSLPWKDQGVLNLVNSPHAKLQSVPVRAVTIEEGFWSKRRK